MAHHTQELSPQPRQFLLGCHVLYGHDKRLDLALPSIDGRGIDQGGHRPAVGYLDDNLLGAHRLARAQRLRQGELFEGDFPPIGASEGQYLQELLQGATRHEQVAEDPARLPVERY